MSDLDDDYGSGIDSATKGVLQIGGTVSGKIDFPGDVDWFKLTLQADTSYIFSLAGPGGDAFPSIGAGSVLSLMDGAGAVITSGLGASNGTAFEYTPAASGVYYLSAYLVNSYMPSYVLSATAVTEPDPLSADIHSTGVLTTGAASRGTFEMRGDSDWFKFHADVGQHYVFAYQSSVGLTAINSMLVYDASGKMITYPGGVFEPLVGGIYFLAATGTTAGDYALLLKTRADDYSANASAPGMVSPGAPAKGVIEYAGDVDRFNIQVDAGQTYTLELTGNGLDQRYQQLEIDDGSGILITSGESYANASFKLSFTATTSGTYAALVSPANALPVIRAYTLSASVTDDVGDTAASAKAAPLNVAQHGLISLSDDTDVFRITVTAGTQYALQLAQYAAHESGAALSLSITDQNGNAVGQLNSDGYYLLSPSTGGDYDIAVQSSGSAHYVLTPTVISSAPGSGDDTLLGTAHGMVLHGGDGTDTVLYGGQLTNYRIVRNGDHVEVKDVASSTPDLQDGVERLVFNDSHIALDINGVGGQAYRLYQAAFDRTPDLPGLGFWMNFMDHGMRLPAVANRFLASAEFVTRYGSNTSDEAFVTLLYNNVLHRDPEPAGQQHWLDALHGGLTRAQALAGFSESAENQAALISVIGNGFQYISYGS